jgi:transposase
MNEMQKVLGSWQLNVKAVREQMYGATTSRERERWHAMWLLAQGWSAAQVGEALDRDAHTIGDWLEALRQKGPTGLEFEQSGGPPPALDQAQQATLKAAVQTAPSVVGLDLAKWTWKGAHCSSVPMV